MVIVMDNDGLLLRAGNTVSKDIRPRDVKSSVLTKSDASVILWNPKYAHNVGTILRACSCWGAGCLMLFGNRVELEENPIKRLPREERMKGYADVSIVNYQRPFDLIPDEYTPVAVELVPGTETLTQFEHPEKAIYVFGPEDGSLNTVALRLCHRFVAIPSRHCLNLAASVYTVLYDRFAKTNPYATVQETLKEERG